MRRLTLLAVVCLGAGCSWLDKVRNRDAAGGGQVGDVPRATAEQLIARLNQNAATVSSVRYDDVSITMDGPEVPIGGGSMANSSLIAARPKLFLLKGGKNARSDLFRVGSNEREMWVLIPTGVSDRELVYCSHEDFPRAANKLPVPVDPDWALVALGLAGTDPNPALYKADTNVKQRVYTLTREETTPGGRKVERTTVFTAGSPTGSDPIVRQHLITDPSTRKVIARADILSVYRVPETNGAEVPTDLKLEWPEQKFTMRLKLRQPVVNEPMDAARLREFERPVVPGAAPVNLAEATARPQARGAAPTERRGIFGLRRE